MKKLIVLLIIVSSFLTQKCYSQNLTASLLRDINIKLAEGIECKLIVSEMHHEIIFKDSLISQQSGKIENLNKQVLSLSDNSAITKANMEAAFVQMDKCNADKLQFEKDAFRLKKGRNTWRTISLLGILAVGIVGYLNFR